MHAVTCRQLIEFLEDYLSGAQPPEVRASFEEHLAMCPYCVDYLNTFRAATRMGQEVFARDESAVPPTVPEELVQAVLAARKGR